MKKSLLVALCLGLAAITAAAQRNYSQHQAKGDQPVHASLIDGAALPSGSGCCG